MKQARIFLALALISAGTCFAGSVQRTDPPELIVVKGNEVKATTLSAMPVYAIAAPFVVNEIPLAYCVMLPIAPVSGAAVATTPTVEVKEKTTVTVPTGGYCYKRRFNGATTLTKSGYIRSPLMYKRPDPGLNA